MHDEPAQKIWQHTCEKYLKSYIGDIGYQSFFLQLEPQLRGQRDFLLFAPNPIVYSFVKKYEETIKDSLEKSSQIAFDLEILVKSEAAHPSLMPAPTPDSVKATALNPSYTFDNFVVGQTNSFAHAACVAVAEQLGGKEFNPLFIFGGSGLGKTHLMQAIGNHVHTKHPDKRIIYVQSEKFVNEFIQVIATKRYDAFRNKYRHVDLLLIDDIQFIEKKEQMQEEFFHTFNTIYESGKNIVLTCDKPPASLQTLQERLKTRISSGITVDIAPPEYETRMAILKRLADSRGIRLQADVMDYIASHITSNIRELEGAFKTLMATCLLGIELNLENCKNALKDLVQPVVKKKLSPSFVMTMVSNYFHISVDEILSRKRKKEIILARHVAMYLCYELMHMTYSDIGRSFGDLNHSTVMHAVRKIEGSLSEDASLQEDLQLLKKSLQPAP